MRIHKILPVVALSGALLLTSCSSSTDGSGSAAGSSGSSSTSSSSSSSAAPKPTDAKAFVNDALDAFKAADSVHVSGTFTDTDGDLGVDIKYGADVAIGTLTISGAAVEISKVADGTTYLKGSADFYRSVGAPEESLALIADKYVKVDSSTEGFSDFVTLLDRDTFAEQIAPSSSDTLGEITGPKTVNGIEVYGIEESDGAFYARADGDPLPVQLSSSGDGKLDFDGYGDAVDVPTPPADQIVDIPTS